MSNEKNDEKVSQTNPQQKAVDNARYQAHRTLDAAERAWYEYAGLVDVGEARIKASRVVLGIG